LPEKEKVTKKKSYGLIKELVYNRVDSSAAFVAKEGPAYFVVVDGRKGPDYEMVVTPMFSPDGKKLVYRAREGGKRFVVVADAAGKEHRRLSEHEMVFATVFTADGSSIAYGVKDGNQLVWKVEKL
jgi:hypothetical protein